MTHKLSIRADGVSLQLGENLLFEGLSFELNNGEAIVINGENGSGKTSLLNVIAGQVPVKAGSISATLDTQAIDANELANHSNYLGHQDGLKAQQTVRENLDFWSNFYEASELSSLEAARQMDVAHMLDLPVAALSRGQKRRVGFARLLVGRKQLWLLDEPTAALDTNSSQLVEEISKKFLDQGGAIIAASHLPFLDSLAKKLLIDDFKPSAQAAGDAPW